MHVGAPVESVAGLLLITITSKYYGPIKRALGKLNLGIQIQLSISNLNWLFVGMDGKLLELWNSVKQMVGIQVSTVYV